MTGGEPQLANTSLSRDDMALTEVAPEPLGCSCLRAAARRRFLYLEMVWR